MQGIFYKYCDNIMLIKIGFFLNYTDLSNIDFAIRV